ncbi:MAG: dephospho-CoA kinase [Candidatus Fluviicola riflensis]|nr:MAG: dephospho-CoA kinase [Candidatus Fluviicola riflensis]OGS76802.1 MAG: dephospho-CoA kinase [Candidatus Fluviicola riflensis]OGS82843.1 MAG: dephospho-CoA kinase [Fluviicola sp. RIFCSPHIGHO2_01_FULL_43_53]OGS88532.1 MAG: dephospho-CoA kinase [Fluviicola sp. RIFCSPHIGHO2_12_FULL_43_24]
MIAPLKVGITGGIGSGKSTVCAVLKAMGHPVYNSDERAKTIMETSSEVREQLISVFGEPTFENNQLNRPYLAQAIFNDPAKREQINAIVHPVVRTDFQQWANSQTSSIIFQESALLIETGGYRLLDFTVLVTAPEELRVQRVLKRDAADETAVRSRIKSQLSDEEQRKSADFVIRNDERSLLVPQVNELLMILLFVRSNKK